MWYDSLLDVSTAKEISCWLGALCCRDAATGNLNVETDYLILVDLWKLRKKNMAIIHLS